MGAKYHQGQPSRLEVLGTEVLTVSTTVAALTVPTDPSLLGIFIEVQGQPVRWLPGATDPTASLGYKLAANDTATLFIDPSTINFIRDASATGDATVVVTYLGA